MLVIDYDTPESFQTIPIHITNPFFFYFIMKYPMHTRVPMHFHAVQKVERIPLYLYFLFAGVDMF